jgi:putative transposase
LRIRSEDLKRRVSEARLLRELESANAKLTRLLTDAMLDQAVLKDLFAKNGEVRRKREPIAHL